MTTQSGTVLNLRVGNFVEVKRPGEILATLDGAGAYEALPFMPEMLAYCGQRFMVYKRAEKICDTIDKTGIRRMRDAVLLAGVHCDGRSHGGCDAGCMIIWKEVWLRKIGSAYDLESVPITIDRLAVRPNGSSRADEEVIRNLVDARAQLPPTADGATRYLCQNTELKNATTPLKVWDLRQYWRDVRSGNIGLWQGVEGLLIMFFNWVQSLRGGSGYPYFERGHLKTTPKANLNLQIGELVRVKNKEDILRTLDAKNRNRGLGFDNEMLKHCGKEYRVKRKIQRLVNERTGELVTMSNDCIILEDVVCHGECHQFCSRSEDIYWREVWLSRSA